MLEGCEIESGTSGKLFLICQQRRHAFFPLPLYSVSSTSRAAGMLSPSFAWQVLVNRM